jgi:hypothetical protein
LSAGRIEYALVVAICALSLAACTDRFAVTSGVCAAEADSEPRCGAAVAAGATSAALGLVAYSCTGTARPDEAPTYVESVPRGLLCADRALPGDADAHGYCCTAATTSCAFDPASSCVDPTFGFTCRGANRPESLNPALSCGNGIREGELINYCCSGTSQPDGCLQTDGVLCPKTLQGWTCMGSNRPRAEQLGANKSRADDYYLLCPTPTPAGNPLYNNYCCYPQAPLPIGGTCVQHGSVPGCAPGRFGFACYGPDTPEEDYLPMRCPEPGFRGTSAEGYPATLYCCDFQP